ncbi:hypothetical protein CYMTET_42023 [Cymbomonas tetramitiformis]|uniref:Uncharacterized protein n=1 Tax=Cymbomonas tetramitiformis TaxID=36881 RepID=A0AAE0F1E3_9CHLO|nr:hypothetical protein CYMTET_42023 [Cymbomonas tetramitiformis]
MQGDASSAQDPREDLGPHFDDNGNAEDDYDSDKSDDSDDDEYEQLMLLTMLAKGFDDPITPAIQQFLSISAISIPDNETQTAEMNTAELPPLTRNKRKLTSRVTNSTFAPQDDNATHSKRTYREFPATPKYAELRADAMSTRVGLSTWITNVRLTPNEFDILLDMQLDEEEYNIEALDRTLRDLIEEPYNFANEHTDYENSLRETRKRKYSTEEMLYIYLAVMSSSHTDWRAFTMGWKCDPSTIQRIYYHVQRSWKVEKNRVELGLGLTCGLLLQNFVWRHREGHAHEGGYPRGAAHFRGEWEEWERRMMEENAADFFCADPLTDLDPALGVLHEGDMQDWLDDEGGHGEEEDDDV